MQSVRFSLKYCKNCVFECGCVCLNVFGDKFTSSQNFSANSFKNNNFRSVKNI